MPFYGEKLDGLMRARNNCLSGIVNGIDYDEYNPEQIFSCHIITMRLHSARKRRKTRWRCRKNSVLLRMKINL